MLFLHGKTTQRPSQPRSEVERLSRARITSEDFQSDLTNEFSFRYSDYRPLSANDSFAVSVYQRPPFTLMKLTLLSFTQSDGACA